MLSQSALAAIKMRALKMSAGTVGAKEPQGTFAPAHKLPASMRRILSLLLMLLLVLRGLVGTAMAAGMVPVLLPADGPPQPMMQSVQQQAHSVHQAHASDALAAATQAPDQGTTHTPCADPASGPCGDAATHAHSPLCSACEICHSVLLVPPLWGSNLPRPVASEVQPGATARFASAAAALAIKPPIA